MKMKNTRDGQVWEWLDEPRQMYVVLKTTFVENSLGETLPSHEMLCLNTGEIVYNYIERDKFEIFANCENPDRRRLF